MIIFGIFLLSFFGGSYYIYKNYSINMNDAYDPYIYDCLSKNG